MSNEPTKIEEVYTMNVSDLDLHPLAKTTPRMTDENYQALKADIDVNGQLEPITLYRGRIIDGRHRWYILQELEVNTILAIKLPHNTSANELKRIVKSKEIRRHETPTQLAISAYKLMLESTTKMSAKEAAELTGADRRKVGNVKKIATDYGRMDLVDRLFDGDKIDIGSAYTPYLTDSLPAILDWLEEDKITAVKKDTRGKVEMTEEQFLECAVKVTELTGLDIKQVKHISGKLYAYVKDYESNLAEKNAQLKDSKPA